MLIVTVAMIAIIYPALSVMTHGSVVQFTLAQMALAVPVGMAGGLQGAMVVELFPFRTRVTSMSVAYSLTLALAGGTAPLIATWLVSTLGQPQAPAHYVMALGVVGLGLMWPMPETNGALLDQ